MNGQSCGAPSNPIRGPPCWERTDENVSYAGKVNVMIESELTSDAVLIKSVLDVKDDTAPPKSASGEAIFDRSILILAPERALKFTAPNRERHYLWLTALSFLAESGRGPPQVPRVPVKSADRSTAKQTQMLAVGRYDQAMRRAVTDTGPLFAGILTQPKDSASPSPNGSSNGAEPPAIPRVSAYRHQRKRSSTNPALPPPSLRSFSSNAVGSTVTSALARATTNNTLQNKSQGTSSHSGSRRTSVVSPDQPNFFEAMGTVRMEAFVDPNYHDGVLYVPAGPAASLKRHSRQRRNNSILSSTTTTEERRGGGSGFDEGGRDLFKGF